MSGRRMNKPFTIPYWRLSGYYFHYFAALGAFMPYWSMYLEDKGFSSSQIGQLMALLALSKLLSPNLWGWLADHLKHRALLIRLTSLMTAIAFSLIDRVDGFTGLAISVGVLGLFWNAPLPLFESVTLAYFPGDPHRYSRIRLWGSVGFVVAVMFFGWVLNNGMAIVCLPQAIMLLLLWMSVISLTIKEPPVRPTMQAYVPVWAIFKRSEVLAAFFVFILVQMMHGPYYVFFSIYLEQNGYDNGQIGRLWALGVLSEVLLFVFAGVLLRHFSIRWLMVIALALGIVRWIIIGSLIQHWYWIALAQILHAATFGATHLVAMAMIQRYFSGAHQAKGQTLYSSVAYGLGGMFGSYIAGELWSRAGPESVYLFSAATSLLALIVALGWVDRGRVEVTA
jgi:MFS transporter, PPP family, 3-phenylpropionic acid transporter